MQLINSVTVIRPDAFHRPDLKLGVGYLIEMIVVRFLHPQVNQFPALSH